MNYSVVGVMSTITVEVVVLISSSSGGRLLVMSSDQGKQIRVPGCVEQRHFRKLGLSDMISSVGGDLLAVINRTCCASNYRPTSRQFLGRD